MNWLDLEARMYDAQVGRFHAVDPLPDTETQESLSPYQYAWNDPINKSDPDGKCPNCITAGIGALVGAGIELGGQLLSGKSLEEVDWADVGVEALKGAVAGSGAGLIVTAAVEVGGAVVKGAVDVSFKDGKRDVFSGTKSVKEAAVDAATDYVAGKVGGAVAKKMGNAAEGFAKKSALNSNTADRAADIAKRGAKNAPENAGKGHYAKVLAKEAKGANATKKYDNALNKVVKSKVGNVQNEALQNRAADKTKEKIMPTPTN